MIRRICQSFLVLPAFTQLGMRDTGVGLLARSCPTLRLLRIPAHQAPFTHGHSPVKNIRTCHFLLPGIFPHPGIEPRSPHCRQTLYQLIDQGTCIRRLVVTSNSASQVCLSPHERREPATVPGSCAPRLPLPVCPATQSHWRIRTNKSWGCLSPLG